MKTSFNTLLESIALSIQQAQDTMERQAIDTYLSYFHNNDEKQNAGVIPKLHKFKIALGSRTDAENKDTGTTSARLLEVPEAALAHHHSMCLDTVKVKLNVKNVEMDGEALRMEVSSFRGDGSSNTDKDADGELEIVFKNNPSSEGIARVTLETLKIV